MPLEVFFIFVQKVEIFTIDHVRISELPYTVYSTSTLISALKELTILVLSFMHTHTRDNLDRRTLTHQHVFELWEDTNIDTGRTNFRQVVWLVFESTTLVLWGTIANHFPEIPYLGKWIFIAGTQAAIQIWQMFKPLTTPKKVVWIDTR